LLKESEDLFPLLASAGTSEGALSPLLFKGVTDASGESGLWTRFFVGGQIKKAESKLNLPAIQELPGKAVVFSGAAQEKRCTGIPRSLYNAAANLVL
jgi:hypothetical protein